MLGHVDSLEAAPCTVANMKHFNLSLLLQHSINYAINVRLVPVEEVP